MLAWDSFGAFVDTLRSSSDPRELLERLLHGLVTLLRASRGFVLLRQGTKSELVPVASWKVEDEEALLRISRTVYGRALETGATVFVDSADEGDWLQGASEESLAVLPRSIICCPLTARGQTFGVIYLDGHVGRCDVDHERIPVVETVAGLAAELLAAAQTRRGLLAAQGKLEAFSALVGESGSFVLGSSAASQEVERLLAAAAPQEVSVLVTGETGTGKEMVARALHRMSSRRMGPFVPVNCAALPRDIVEAELFGAERGAYTGSTERRIGRFELAAGGTLFIDEVGELPVDVQVKLLRVLQERTLTRLGGTGAVALDFRLVCATNRDLEAGVAEGWFRQDLYYRINVFRLHLQPLRSRREDIRPLAEHFLTTLAARCGKRVEGFTPEAMALVEAYPWPGNIRELRNAVERAVVVETDSRIQARSLPVAQAAPEAQDLMGQLLTSLPPEYERAAEVFERAFLERALARHDGNIAAVARETGIPRNTLYRRMGRLDLLAR